MRNRWGISLLVGAVLALGYWSGLKAQQDPPAANGNGGDSAAQVAALEKKVSAMEKTLASLTMTNGNGGGAPLQTRVQWMEDRLARLEAKSLSESGAMGGSGADRVLEGRVRALEMEISRIRR